VGLGVRVGLTVLVNVAVGGWFVRVGSAVSDTVDRSASLGSWVNVGGKGLGTIVCDGSAIPEAQPVITIKRRSRICNFKKVMIYVSLSNLFKDIVKKLQIFFAAELTRDLWL
jgi:hypothetical protein